MFPSGSAIAGTPVQLCTAGVLATVWPHCRCRLPAAAREECRDMKASRARCAVGADDAPLLQLLLRAKGR